MSEKEILKYQNKKEIIKSIILGFFIGLAGIVPGISGSTMAIIFKLYDKLLYAIGNIVKQFKLCFIFLLPIALGGIIGVSVGFFAIQKLLKILPFATIAFFAGLMIGAFPAILDEIKNEKITCSKISLFLLGFGIPLMISIASTWIQTGNQNFQELEIYQYILFIVIGYMIAITQVVPGLSATALLMAFGYFVPLIESINLGFIKANPSILIVYICLGFGFIIGMITFSNFLTKLLNKDRKLTFFMISGLSLGSIATMFFNPDINKIYQSWIHGNMSFGLDISVGILLFIIGLLLSISFLKYKNKVKN